ncbi:hypothetical protein ACQKWADRAFT_300516 [Trichoderma austrokoningii]
MSIIYIICSSIYNNLLPFPLLSYSVNPSLFLAFLSPFTSSCSIIFSIGHVNLP